MDLEQYSDPEDIYYDDEYEDEDQYEADLSTTYVRHVLDSHRPILYVKVAPYFIIQSVKAV